MRALLVLYLVGPPPGSVDVKDPPGAGLGLGDTLGAQILARIGNDYVRVFTTFGIMALLDGVIAWLFVPKLKHMMGEFR